MDDYDLHLGWSFVRTLEQELGIAVDLAERIQEIVETSGHYPTRDEMETVLAQKDELENERDNLTERLEEHESLVGAIRLALSHLDA